MRKIVVFICALLIFQNCKQSKKGKVNNIIPSVKGKNKIKVDSLPYKENIHNKEKPKISQIEFLNYIDDSLIFQEAIDTDKMAYAFVCHGNKKQMLFSGKIYLKPPKKDELEWESDEYRSAIIDSINNIFTKDEIHKRFSLWAQITHKEYFMPYSERIDNPCEYYKENREVVIYKSKIGQNSWEELEKTKNLKKITILIDNNTD